MDTLGAIHQCSTVNSAILTHVTDLWRFFLRGVRPEGKESSDVAMYPSRVATVSAFGIDCLRDL